METVGDLISITLGQLLEGLSGMTGTFVEVGFVFLSLAFLLSALGGMYNWWTSGSMEDLVANGVRTLLVVAPLALLLSGWSGYMNTFTALFYKEIPAAMGTTGDTASTVAANSMKQIMNAVEFQKPPPDANNKEKGWWSKAWDAISLSNFYTLILQVIVLILNMFLIFGILFALFMPVASLMVGAIFGPLLLPWMAWRPLAGMTERWTGFMIANGLSFVVAIVILKAMTKTIEALTKQMQGMANEGFLSGLAGMSVTLVALFAIYIFATNLLLAANNIAQGMTGGAAIGEGLFGKVSAAMASGGMMRTAGATGNLGKMAAAGAGKAAAKAPGAIGQGLDAAGKQAQALGTAAAISNAPGGTALSAAGNALRASSAPLNAAQAGINKAGNVLSKAGDSVKNSAVYKELDKPIMKLGSGGPPPKNPK